MPQGDRSTESGGAQRRIGWLDSLKGLGMIAVTLYHSGPPQAVIRLITPWFLPVFYFAAGYVYKDAYSRTPFVFLKKRLRALYVPYVLWNLLYLCLHNLFLHLDLMSDKAGYLDWVASAYTWTDYPPIVRGILTMSGGEAMAGPLWFLTSLLTADLLFCGLGVVSTRIFRGREWVRALGVVAVFGVGYSNQQIVSFPIYLNYSAMAMVFIYVGFLYRRAEARIALGYLRALLAAVMLALLVSLGGSRAFLPGSDFSDPVLLIVTALAGIFVCLVLAKKLGRNRFVQYVGRNSLFLIATQFLAFKLVSLVQIEVYGYPHYMLGAFPVVSGSDMWWAAYLACAVLVPVGVKLSIDFASRSVRSWVVSR